MPQPAAAYTLGSSPVETVRDLKSRTMYLPRMPYGGTRMLAAAFKSIGLDARPVPDEDARTLELGAKYTSGDECYPQRIVLGDFLKLLEDDKVDPDKTALLLPTANGPCRFGQYCRLVRRILDEQGFQDVDVFSFTSADGYAGIGDQAGEVIRTAWRAVVVQDILMKLLLMTRPYEVNPGQTDKVYLECLDLMDDDHLRAEAVQQGPAGASSRPGCAVCKAAVPGHPGEARGPAAHRRGGRDLLPPQHLQQQRAHPPHRSPGRRVLAHRHRRVGALHQRRGLPPPPRREDPLRQGVAEDLPHHPHHAQGRARPLQGLRAHLRRRPEPAVPEVLETAHPYLPQEGALGEMVLSTGGAIAYYRRGADGIVDISPFTCMNGIVNEAVYPRVSKDHDDIPIRVFYFDGTNNDLDRDVGIFLELAKTYKRRKKIARA